MNVLFLLPALVRGGSETKTVTLANLWAAKREPPAIAYLLERPAPLRAEIDPRVPMLCLRRKGKFSLGALLRLRALIERERVPLVLCMNLYPVLYASAVRLLLGRDAFKLIVAVNITEFARIRDRLFMALYRSLLRLADAIVFGCELQRELWQRRYRLAAVPAWVIYNGVDVRHFAPGCTDENLRERLGLGARFIVGVVARLDAAKNQRGLLRAAAMLAAQNVDVHVLLAGDGPDRAHLERLAAKLGIEDRVTLLGEVRDPRPVLAALDVFVLPSVSVETFSNSALQAMAMSVPVVLSRVGGAEEMVANGESGLLYAADDLTALARLLRQLHDDAPLRKRLGAQGRDRVLEKFSIERMAAAYRTLLETSTAEAPVRYPSDRVDITDSSRKFTTR